MTNGQTYYFRHYQVENGLSNNTVFCSTQDSNGFMWFGTKDGLNRFNGHAFKIFQLPKKQNKQLNTDYIYALSPDSNGVIWVGAMSGLYKFNSKEERLEPFIDSLKSIANIQLDYKHRLWFTANSILYRYDLTTGKLKRFSQPKGFNVSSICLTSNGNIWVATSNGYLEEFNNKGQHFTSYNVFSHSPHSSTRLIEKIKPGGNNIIYIGTQSQGVKRFNISTHSYEDILTYGFQKTPLFVRDIVQFKKDEFWFATESGIYILNTHTHKFLNLHKDYENPYSFDDNAVYTLYKDKEGSVWAGTYFGGINYYSKHNSVFKKYFPNSEINRISGNIVGDICSDRYGNLWIATEDNGINKINQRTGKITQFTPGNKKGSISYTNIHALVAIGNELWIGTFQHGIDVLDIPSGKVVRHYNAGPDTGDIKSNFAYSFLYTKSKKLFIGTTDGVFYYNKLKDNFRQVPIFKKNIYGKPMIEDHSGIIWIGAGRNGLYWYNPQTKTSGKLNILQNNDDINNKIINDIYEDDKNNLWIATEGGGICKINPSRTKCKWYSTHTGLPGNFIFKILEDNNHLLWISSSKGLVCFNPITEKVIKVYTQANGLLSNQFNYHSGFKAAGGKLYFGSVKGLIAFNPPDLISNPSNPPIFITGFQVFDQELAVNNPDSSLPKSLIYTDKIVLSHRQSSISINFAALSYISPKMTKYSYRLKGLEDKWTTINTNRKVYFTNLTPGTYTFEVKAKIDNHWDNHTRQLTIIIKPPIWLTNWAIALYILTSLFIIFLLLKNYHKRQRNKKEKEIYRSKFDFFTNVAHEIRTPLTLIKGPVENLLEKEFDSTDMKEDVECLNRNTNRLMDLATQILDFRQTEIKNYNLYLEEVNVNEVLSETFLSFKILAKKKNIHYEMSIPSQPVKIMADKDALQKIFSNLIGNAVKYAEKQIRISVIILEGYNASLKIEFENDGFLIPEALKEKIFDPFYRIKETHYQKGTGIGLSLSRSLTELHNGKLYLVTTGRPVNTFVLILPFQTEYSTNNIKARS